MCVEHVYVVALRHCQHVLVCSLSLLGQGWVGHMILFHLGNKAIAALLYYLHRFGCLASSEGPLPAT
jgi:hypothetical protein